MWAVLEAGGQCGAHWDGGGFLQQPPGWGSHPLALLPGGSGPSVPVSGIIAPKTRPRVVCWWGTIFHFRVYLWLKMCRYGPCWKRGSRLCCDSPGVLQLSGWNPGSAKARVAFPWEGRATWARCLAEHHGGGGAWAQKSGGVRLGYQK